AARTDHRRRDRALRPAQGVRPSGPDRDRGRARLRPNGDPARRARNGRGDARRLARTRESGRAVPQPARRSRVHARALARRRLPPLASTLRIDMAPSFKLVASAPRTDLFVAPVFSGARLGPGADLVDDAIGGSLATFMKETDFEGKRGEVLAVPVDGQLKARAAL